MASATPTTKRRIKASDHSGWPNIAARCHFL